MLAAVAAAAALASNVDTPTKVGLLLLSLAALCLAALIATDRGTEGDSDVVFLPPPARARLRVARVTATFAAVAICALAGAMALLWASPGLVSDAFEVYRLVPSVYRSLSP